MRILIVHNRYTQRGGEDVVFEAETALLREQGHEVFTWEQHNDDLSGRSPLATATNAIWSFESQKELAGLLAQIRPDVAHFHNTFLKVSPAAYYTCQAAGVPVVQTLHNYRLLCPAATFLRDGKVCEACLGHWGLWPSIRYGCWHSSSTQTAVVAAMLTTHRWLRTWQKQVDIYITLTEFARQKFIDAGIPAEKIRVKPNFIVAAPPIDTVSAPRASYALFVGRLSPEKGLELVVEAWRQLPEVPLRIVGNGPLRAKLEAYIRQHDLRQVELLGARPQEEVFAMMQEAELLVVPSRGYEGLPLTIIEAFSRRLPVVATRHGSMGEIVTHGETGLHFTPQDHTNLAHWVRWAWEHPAEMRQIAENGFREFQTKYSPETNYQQLLAIYQYAIHRRKATPN